MIPFDNNLIATYIATDNPFMGYISPKTQYAFAFIN